MVTVGTNKEVNENGKYSIRENYKMVFVGNNEVGKTSIINKYFYNEDISLVKPTEGIEMRGINVKLKSKEVRLIIWDISGKNQYLNLIDLYVQDTFALFLIYDTTNRSSFNNIKDYLNKVIKIKDNSLLIVVIGTKCDLTTQRCITETEGIELTKESKAIHVETSSINGKGLDTLREIIENALNKVIKEDIVAIDNKICFVI